MKAHSLSPTEMADGSSYFSKQCSQETEERVPVTEEPYDHRDDESLSEAFEGSYQPEPKKQNTNVVHLTYKIDRDYVEKDQENHSISSKKKFRKKLSWKGRQKWFEKVSKMRVVPKLPSGKFTEEEKTRCDNRNQASNKGSSWGVLRSLHKNSKKKIQKCLSKIAKMRQKDQKEERSVRQSISVHKALSTDSMMGKKPSYVVSEQSFDQSESDDNDADSIMTDFLDTLDKFMVATIFGGDDEENQGELEGYETT